MCGQVRDGQILELRQEIATKDQEIATKNRQMEVKDREIAAKDQEIIHLSQQLQREREVGGIVVDEQITS